jgi:hypothetical protein
MTFQDKMQEGYISLTTGYFTSVHSRTAQIMLLGLGFAELDGKRIADTFLDDHHLTPQMERVYNFFLDNLGYKFHILLVRCRIQRLEGWKDDRTK